MAEGSQGINIAGDLHVPLLLEDLGWLLVSLGEQDWTTSFYMNVGM